jgi:hypothetical protein
VALAIAAYLIQQKLIEHITVVSPTEPLTRQWCDAAAMFGIALMPDVTAKAPIPDRKYIGSSVTYQLVGGEGAPAAFTNVCLRRRTLVTFDECHHMGREKPWGDSVEAAFGDAEYRVLLSGTATRSDTRKIPFASYETGEDGVERIVPDFVHGNGRAVRDHVIRDRDTRFYDGEVNELGYGETVPVSFNLSEAVNRDDHSKLMGIVMDPNPVGSPS